MAGEGRQLQSRLLRDRSTGRGRRGQYYDRIDFKVGNEATAGVVMSEWFFAASTPPPATTPRQTLVGMG